MIDIDEYFDFYRKVNDNQAIKEALVAKMFEIIYERPAKAQVGIHYVFYAGIIQQTISRLHIV